MSLFAACNHMGRALHVLGNVWAPFPYLLNVGSCDKYAGNHKGRYVATLSPNFAQTMCIFLQAPNNEVVRPPSVEQRERRPAISIQEQMGLPFQGHHSPPSEPAQLDSPDGIDQQRAASQLAGPADIAQFQDALLDYLIRQSQSHRMQAPPQYMSSPAQPLQVLHLLQKWFELEGQPAHMVQPWPGPQGLSQAAFLNALMQAIADQFARSGMPQPIDASTRNLSQSVPEVGQYTRGQMKPSLVTRSLSQGLPEAGNDNPRAFAPSNRLEKVAGSAFKRVIPTERHSPSSD